MKYCIEPGPLSGQLEVPSSKSHTLRALLFGLMGKGKTVIRKPLDSPDTKCMIEAIKSLGAEVKTGEGVIEIEGVGGQLKSPDDIIFSGNSGIILRFIGGLASLLPSYTVITGDHSIRHNRPILPLLEGLRSLGVFAESMRPGGYAPLIVKGPLQGGYAKLDGRDSQPVSALLIAGSFAQKEVRIQVENPGEKPWIDLTLYWLGKLNLPYHNDRYSNYWVPGGSGYEGFDYTVPGDFSTLAFPLAAALITDSDLTLENVDMEDVQGDKKLILILQEMGANITIDGEKKILKVKKGSFLRGLSLDINDYIDAITILAVIGCFAEGKTELRNARVARQKECDRIHAIASELKKMGAAIEEKEDGLVIYKSELRGAILESYGDHRMALSLSVAALAAQGQSMILGTECVNKTYSNFAGQFQMLGAQIKEKK